MTVAASGQWTRRRFLALGAAGCWISALGTGRAWATEPNAGAVARWPHEWQVDDFHFHSDFDVRGRSDVIDQLRGLRTDLADTLAIRIERETIHLILFSSAHNYRAYLKQYFPEIPERRALFIKRRGPGMVFAYDNREMAVDLRHETTHALLNASLPFVPLWLDEGLGEYFEVPAADRVGGHVHLKLTKFRALLGQVREMATLEEIGDLAAMGAAEYRDAWSWVHFLLNHSPQTLDVLRRFMQDIQSGLPPGPLSRRVAAAIPDYRDRYLHHFRAA